MLFYVLFFLSVGGGLSSNNQPLIDLATQVTSTSDQTLSLLDPISKRTGCIASKTSLWVIYCFFAGNTRKSYGSEIFVDDSKIGQLLDRRVTNTVTPSLNTAFSETVPFPQNTKVQLILKLFLLSFLVCFLTGICNGSIGGVFTINTRTRSTKEEGLCCW